MLTKKQKHRQIVKEYIKLSFLEDIDSTDASRAAMNAKESEMIKSFLEEFLPALPKEDQDLYKNWETQPEVAIELARMAEGWAEQI